MGYDGKGQVPVDTARRRRARRGAQWEACRACSKKSWRCDLRSRLSHAAQRDGNAVTFPLAENEHRGGILATSIAPARVDDRLPQRAREAALTLAERMNYVGVLCVEFFVLQRRLAARQRDRAAAAQLRPLHDRRMRDEPVRAAGARDGESAARRYKPDHAVGHAEHPRRSVVR